MARGMFYLADSYHSAIKKWTAANSNLTTLVSSGLYDPLDVAVDGTGNIYIADTENNAIKELPYVFVDPTPRNESMFAGSNILPAVLPFAANMKGPFAPASDQSWLTINGATNGVVSFSFTQNAGASRTAHISLLGQSISVTQGGPAFSLGSTSELVGSAAGSNSVVLGVLPNFGVWSNSANASWLHLNPASQSGAGSTNVLFSFDSNPGAIRTGTLTIAGNTLTVTQAGSNYVAARPLVPLVQSGLLQPQGVCVDSAGNLYIADTGNHQIEKWSVANNVTTVAVSGLGSAEGVAVDGAAMFTSPTRPPTLWSNGILPLPI